MRKYLFAVVAAVAGLVALNGSAAALMIAFRPAPQRAMTADVVVVGKVTAIEKNTVDAAPFPGAKDKVAYKVAVVKIETNLGGAANLTHIKIGFIPPAKVQPGGPGGGPDVVPLPAPPVGGPAILPAPGRPIRPGFQAPELKEGQEMLFFLSKHPSADFYMMPGMSPPVDVKSDAGKKELEAVKKVTDVIADPMKGLKSDKAEVRAETAAIMVQKYRSYPETGGEVDQVAINADESKLILKAIAEGDWSNRVRPGADFGTSPVNAFYQLGLTDKDGWKQPMFPRPQPGQPPVDFNAIVKKSYTEWLAGAGKDYVIKKIVPKKK
jgi:hypothetical protein